MKRALCVSLIIILLLSCFLPVYASAAKTDGDLTYVIRGEEVTITGCNREVFGDLIIPDTIEGYPVTTIGAKAFATCKNLTGITIPDSVTTIKNSAFNACTALTTVDLGKGVTNVGSTAFSVCTNLTSVTLPDSVIFLGEMVFAACDNLTGVTFGSGIQEINRELFYLSPNLSAIEVSENNQVYSSQDGVLFNKDQTVLELYPAGKTDGVYTIPDTVTELKERAFLNCENLTEIIFPENLQVIGENAFAGCNNLTSISVPAGIVSIESGTFSNCRRLTEITIGPAVSTIEEGAFEHCTSLRKVSVVEENPYFIAVDGVLFNTAQTIIYCYPAGKNGETYTVPEGVERIVAYAFSHCRLTSITVPSSLLYVEENAFDNCLSIKDVYYQGSKEEFSGSYVNIVSGAQWHFEDEQGNQQTTAFTRIIVGVFSVLAALVFAYLVVRSVRKMLRPDSRSHPRVHPYAHPHSQEEEEEE